MLLVWRTNVNLNCQHLDWTVQTYTLGGGAGAGLYSSKPIVAGKTLIISSTVHRLSFWMVLIGSGSFNSVTSPSVTWKMCPLTCSDSSDANQVTNGATSSASPSNPAPAAMPREFLKSRDSCGTLVVIRVAALGAIELTVTPYLPRSRAATRVSPAIPSLAAP